MSAGAVTPLLRFLRRYVAHSVEDMTAALREHGLTMPQVATLQFLHHGGPQDIGGIASHVGLSLTATSHLVERLVARDLVERGEDRTDRRRKRVALAAEGREIVRDLERRADASLHRLLRGVPQEDRERLELAVTAVLEALEGPLNAAGRRG